MNNEKEYRIAQFKNISTVYIEYKTKIKFIKPNGETNWLDISNNELVKIMELLTSQTYKENHFGELI